MSEELGKIEKPPVDEFKSGRRILFVPLIFSGREMPAEYYEKCNNYWEQVDSQLAGLEANLGSVKHIFHELVSDVGETGLKSLEEMKMRDLEIVRKRVSQGTILESTEDHEILDEIMDWTRCLSAGLQSQKAFSVAYNAYTEANKKRYETISKKISEALKENELAIVILGENHRVQFPADARIFYVAPPALDALQRWVRDFEAKQQGAADKAAPQKEEKPEEPGN